MLHPPVLLEPAAADDPTAPFADIMLNAFQAPDRSEAAVVVNAMDRKQTVRFRWQDRDHTLQMEPWAVRLVRH
jgi:hypothetical protein